VREARGVIPLAAAPAGDYCCAMPTRRTAKAELRPPRRTGPPPSVDRLEKICLEKGLRMTDQRRVIARVLSEAEDHPDVDQVYRRASAVDPRISIATVYRTVRLFEAAGILERHEFGDGRARYEPAGLGHHDHLINMKTGEVIEFSNEQIERLQEGVARELGFRLIGHRLELFGVPLKTGK
jgi:Fur family transcriptional regulator, ferric uptake regulator